MDQSNAIDLQKLIGLINDPSAKIKIDGLRAIDNIKNWSVYSVSEIKQLFEILDQNINYPRSDVRLHVEHAHAKVKKALGDLMATNPLDFASSISAELVSDEPSEERAAASKAQAPHAPKAVKSYARETIDDSSADIISSVEAAGSGVEETGQQPADTRQENQNAREAKNAALKS
ncbi:MAG TPA: hypothetical protein PKL57_14290, partial [Candidatus Wallbacteria bacterium]|nr:hypothetical protein [Candidatus Wallbacteria bacterium]